MGVTLVKVVSPLGGRSSDCGRHIRRVAPYISLTACSVGGGLLVGVGLVKVVSLLDGWSSDCEDAYGGLRRTFFNGLLLGWRSSCGCWPGQGCKSTRRVEL